jgi:hypothetical protein
VNEHALLEPERQVGFRMAFHQLRNFDLNLFQQLTLRRSTRIRRDREISRERLRQAERGTSSATD